jgi:hypothetical protein
MFRLKMSKKKNLVGEEEMKIKEEKEEEMETGKEDMEQQ